MLLASLAEFSDTQELLLAKFSAGTEQWNFLRYYQVKIREYIASSAVVDGWRQPHQ